MGYLQDGLFVWKNGSDEASTPLNATNLNRLESAVYDLYKSKTRVQQVLVDIDNTTGVASDASGQFNDVTKPYLTVGGVLNDLYAGTTTEIFILGNGVIDTNEYRLNNSTVSFIAYDTSDGANTATDTSKLTMQNNAKLRVTGLSSINFYIDTDFANMDSANRGIILGDGSTCNFYNHRTHDFEDSPSNNGYVGYVREAEINFQSSVSVPVVNAVGVSGGVAFADTILVVWGIGTTDVVNIVDTTLNVRANPTTAKVERTQDAPETVGSAPDALFERLNGVVFHTTGASSIPANVTSNISFYGLG